MTNKGKAAGHSGIATVTTMVSETKLSAWNGLPHFYESEIFLHNECPRP